MRNSPADILSQFMVQAGICAPGNPNNVLPTYSEAWPTYVNLLPDSVDRAILFTDTSARVDGRHIRTGQTIEHPGNQILVRSSDQKEAYQKLNYICQVIDAIYRQWVYLDSYAYLLLNVTRRTSITPLNTEQHFKALEHLEKEIKRGRFMFAINVTMTIQDQIDPITLPPSLTYPPLESFWLTQTPSGTIDGSNRVFTISPIIGQPLIFIDGVFQYNSYTLVGTTLTFNLGYQPNPGQTLLLFSINEG